ncbi:helix-turn-helix domain-containing protein [Corynebacterium kefirresidentii]|uniref:helix-turn-helix domain-containing protein n=1 Tax=Corynebacterium kefirresidentii TaxID=1979527 RepID=UPI0020040E56|nr:helix-turn-helix domain-containing protein [Corynebacterium kefirresidentii]MCK6083007.1 helix-turn-helix domain-containing protein [Corynebacterium kefirresidentii]
MPEVQYLKKADIAKMFGVSQSWVEQKHKAGKLPHTTDLAGGKGKASWRFKVEDMEDLFQELRDSGEREERKLLTA